MRKIEVFHLLLLAATVHSAEKCQREARIWYHVYNTNVEIKTYYCFKGDFQCERFHNGKRTENQNIYQRCHDINKSVFGKSEMKFTLCELPAYLDLVENNITFATNNTCSYNKGMCYDNGTYIFWVHKDNCKGIIRLDSGFFDVWTFGKHKQKFINNNVTNLLLTETIRLCGCDVWKTNHNGIIASSNYIKPFINGKLPDFLNNLSTPCEMRENNGYMDTSLKGATKSSKIWYIYEYSVNLTVYFCVKNATISCTVIGFSEIDSESYHDRINRCNIITCGSPKCNLYMAVCKKVLKVNLETDTVGQLLHNCTYSSGLCRAYNAFWTAEDRCSAIRKVHEEQTDGAIRIKNTELDLFRFGKLCGKNVWYTRREGIVVSERQLQFSPSSFGPNNQKDSAFTENIEKINKDELNQDSTAATEKSFPLSHFNTSSYLTKRNEEIFQRIHLQNEEINKLQILLHCAMLLILLCVLWYIFNVIVNFLSLKKLNKTRAPKKRFHLFNCLFQSLTTRRVFFSQQEKEELGGNISGIQTDQLYATVDNELYNKSR